jgi:hypothetical protein
VLSSPLELLELRSQGLPTDGTSIDNALFIQHGLRWPLVIDPQQQCSRWLRAAHGGAGLVSVRASEPGLLKVAESALRMGGALLIDELPDGSLPPGLEGLLAWRPPPRCASAHSAAGDAGCVV